jgi:hypothetical protein
MAAGAARFVRLRFWGEDEKRRKEGTGVDAPGRPAPLTLGEAHGSPSPSLHGQARGASMAGEPPTPYPATRSQSPRTTQPMPLHRTEGESEEEMTNLPPAG